MNVRATTHALTLVLMLESATDHAGHRAANPPRTLWYYPCAGHSYPNRSGGTARLVSDTGISGACGQRLERRWQPSLPVAILRKVLLSRGDNPLADVFGHVGILRQIPVRIDRD